MSETKILQAIYDAVDIVNEQLAPEEQLEKNESTPITGAQADLDSLGFVSLVLAAEEQLNSALGDPVLLAEALLGGEEQVPETLNDLASFVTRLREGSDEPPRL